MKTVLIVEDERAIVRVVRDYLEQAGFRVLASYDAATALAETRASKPDLVILDLGLPDRDGLDVARAIRGFSSTPIIVLTARGTEADRIIGLELGADDYVVKPFSPKELVARIKSLLRRSESSGDNSNNGTLISTPGLEINMDSQTVKCANKQLELRPKEFDLLVLFIKKPNIVLDRSFILENVFGYKIPISTRTIDTHIKNLRHALGPFGKKIKTVFGRGFKFVP